MMIPDGAGGADAAGSQSRARGGHSQRPGGVIALGENDRAHTRAVTARVAIEAAVTALQAALAHTPGG